MNGLITLHPISSLVLKHQNGQVKIGEANRKIVEAGFQM